MRKGSDTGRDFCRAVADDAFISNHSGNLRKILSQHACNVDFFIYICKRKPLQEINNPFHCYENEKNTSGG